VGLDDSFFAIGGHSLLAITLISRLRERANCNLPLDKIFEYPCPEQLAQHLEEIEKENEPALIAGMGQIQDAE
jgi:acyl carrier protein